MKKPAPPNPSIARILWTDYTAFYLTLFPIVGWIICLAWIPSWRADGPIIPAWMAPYVLIISLLITLICLVSLALRLVTIWQVFRKGAQVRGRVALVYLRRDRGRVEYTYMLQGGRISNWGSHSPYQRNPSAYRWRSGHSAGGSFKTQARLYPRSV